MKRYYSPDRMTIAAVNADHGELVKWAEKYFVEQAPSWAKDLENIPPPDQSIAQYTGGIIRVCRHISAIELRLLAVSSCFLS